MYKLRGNAAVKARKFTNRINRVLDNAYVLRISRDEALHLRKLYINQRGYSVLDRPMKKRIKEYSNEKFGSAGYWPWLALYSEYRGEFKEGWIPCDYFRFSILLRWNTHTCFSGLKTMDYRLFKDFSVKPVFNIVNSVIYGPDHEIINPGKLVEYLNNGAHEFIVKNDGGKGGKHIQFLTYNEAMHADFTAFRNAVVQPVIKQHEILNRLYNQSVNTVRVATFLESDGKAVVKFNILRVGTNGSRVDNTASGGLFMMMDMDGNILTQAFDDFCMPAGEVHPDTGVEFNSIKVPGVREASEICCRAHEKFPYVRFVAWDVCIREDAKPVLLEWNTKNPSMWFEEAATGPLWKENDIL